MLHGSHGGINGTLRIQRVEDGLNEQGVYPTLNQRIHLLDVGLEQLAVGQITTGRIADVGRHGARLVRRSYRASHESWFIGSRELVGSLSGQLGTGQSHLSGMTRHTIVGLADALGTKRVGFDDVGTSLEVAAVDVENHVRTRQAEHVIVAAHLSAEQVEPAAEVLFLQVIGLNHGAHSSVEHQYAFLDNILNPLHLSISLNRTIHFATILLFLQCLTLVEGLLTLTQRNVHLGPSVLVEKHQQRHYRVARLFRGALQLSDLALRQQQLAVALHIVIVVRAVEVGRHTHAAHPHLAIDNQTIRVH